MKIATFIPFTQKIPSNNQYTDFLLDILIKLEEKGHIKLNKKERHKLEEILSCSFDQIEILDKEEENIPFYGPDPIFKKD